MSHGYNVIVLKIGTTSITKGAGSSGINYRVLNHLAAAAAELRDHGYKVIIVSSGAMGLGLTKLGKDRLPENIADLSSYKQALTAVGQVELMNAYENVFKHYDAHAGQVLIRHFGLGDVECNDTIYKTLINLFELDVIPIINANDTVSSIELLYGDNDSLSARIATLIKAKRLVILSDVAGLYDKDPNKYPGAKLLTNINVISPEIKAIAGESSSGSGMGGMKSKIAAIEMCLQNGIAADILAASNLDKVAGMISGKVKETLGSHFEKMQL